MFYALSEKISKLFGGFGNKKTLSVNDKQEFVAQMRKAFLEADVPLDTTKELVVAIEEHLANAKPVPNLSVADQLTRSVYDLLVGFLGGNSKNSPALSFSTPSINLVMGLQGAGKTSTIGKLIAWSKQQPLTKKDGNLLICAGSVDFSRPAAHEQLERVTQAAGGYFIKATSSSPVNAAREIIEQAAQLNADHLFIDTAGRMSVDQELMDELVAITNAIPVHRRILVLDSMTGQQSLEIGKQFLDDVSFDSVILTKCDSDSRSGSAIALRKTLSKPIAFIANGEKIDDLEPFYADRMASRIMGLGDIASLIERTDRTLKAHEKDEQEKAAQRFMSGTMTLDDFAQQFSLMNSFGSLSKLARYLPGTHSISDKQLEQGQKEIKRFQAILSSMTKRERKLPRILSTSRKRRIARGSGTEERDVDALIAKFEQSKQFAKMLRSMGGLKAPWAGR